MATATISTQVYEKHPEAIKSDLRQNICKELMKHDRFIEPPMKYRGDKTEVTAYFFCIDYPEVQQLKELSEKYPEIKEILHKIVVG